MPGLADWRAMYRMEYVQLFEEEICGALTAFEPQLVLISAGFDGHYLDPIAGLGLQADTFGELTDRVVAAVTPFGGRVVSALEGGYNLSILGDCVLAHLEALARDV